MAEDKKTLFHNLLDQIAWSQDERGVFADATIDEVDVHTQSQRWDFHITLDDILPYATFLRFEQSISKAFAHIASVRLFIQTRSAQVTTPDLGDYWPWVIANTGLNSPLLAEIGRSQAPYLEEKRVFITVENDVIKNFLVNQALGPIEEAYQRVGFPRFSIKTLVDQTKSQEKIQQLRSEKAKNDQELARRAMEE